MKKDIKSIVNDKSIEGIASLINILSNSDTKGEIFNTNVSKEKFNELIEDALKNGVISIEEANKYLDEDVLTIEERKENFKKVIKLSEKARDVRRGEKVVFSGIKKGDIEHE